MMFYKKIFKHKIYLFNFTKIPRVADHNVCFVSDCDSVLLGFYRYIVAIIVLCLVAFRPYLRRNSSRIQMGALGHTLTPFFSVCRQFFGFIPGDVHVLQISSDGVHPIFPWPSRLSLVAPQFPLYSLMRHSGVLHSQYVSQPPQSSLMMSSNFYNPAFLLISSFLALSFRVIPF